MSKVYREKHGVDIDIITSPEMRKHCQRPGNFDKDGNIVYFTEQAHKDKCDVNKIVKRYNSQGIIDHISRFEATYGDVTGIEFKKAKDQVINAQRMFDELPSKIRKEFENNPQKLLSFMDDPDNREKAIELGLIQNDWTLDSDGLGEWVPKGQNKVKIEEPDVQQKKEEGEPTS